MAGFRHPPFYEHWRETYHDDLMLATALACWDATRRKAVRWVCLGPPAATMYLGMKGGLSPDCTQLVAHAARVAAHKLWRRDSSGGGRA